MKIDRLSAPALVLVALFLQSCASLLSPSDETGISHTDALELLHLQENDCWAQLKLGDRLSKASAEERVYIKLELEALRKKYKDQRDRLLSKYSIPGDHCPIHKHPLKWLRTPVIGGMHVRSADQRRKEFAYYYDRPLLFLFAEQEFDAGCLSCLAAEVELQVCPECVKAAHAWSKV